MRSSVVAAGGVVAVLTAGAVGGVVAGRGGADDVRRLEARLAAVEKDEDTATEADVETLRAELAKVRARVVEVERAAEPVCVESSVESERARLNGANEGSNYESSAYYLTLIGILDTVCGEG